MGEKWRVGSGKWGEEVARKSGDSRVIQVTTHSEHDDMSRLPLMVFLVMAPAGLLQAQGAEQELTLKISPRPERLEIGISKVSFTAVVRRTTLNVKTGKSYPSLYRVSVRCGDKDCYTSPELTVPSGPGTFTTVAFSGTFTVPSHVAAGTDVCANLQSAVVNLLKSGFSFATEAQECRTALHAAAAAIAGGASGSAAAGDPSLSSAPRVRAGVQPRAQARASAGSGSLRLPSGMRPDLVLTYEAKPVARWLVRNIGASKSPATSLRLLRSNVGQRVLPVAAIVPGSYVAIDVTPELDQYLVNSTGMVDPEKQVDELNESNNEWTSASTR